MSNFTLEIKNYQEDVTYLTLKVPSNFTKEEIILLGAKMKKNINEVHPSFVGSPNIVRFVNEQGIFNFQLKQLVHYV